MPRNTELGRFGENIAARYLAEHGFELIERNWRCDRGELDIVASETTTLVICEVKTRSSTRFGDPSEAVGRVKAARLRTLGLCWLRDHPGAWAAIRFDVISV